MSSGSAQAGSPAPPLTCPDNADCEYVRLSEILVKTSKPYDQKRVAVARQKAETLREKLRHGEGFADLAKKYSQGPSAAFGGDVGYFGCGKLSKSMEDVTFRMHVGDISDVIRTKQGFVILEITDRGSEIPPLDVVNAAITPDLRPYLENVRTRIQQKWYASTQKWYASIPVSAQSKTGTVTVNFVIHTDGTVASLEIGSTSGDADMNVAALAAVRDAGPFSPIPGEKKTELALRFHCLYGPTDY